MSPSVIPLGIGLLIGYALGWRARGSHYTFREWRKAVRSIPILRGIFFATVKDTCAMAALAGLVVFAVAKLQ